MSAEIVQRVLDAAGSESLSSNRLGELYQQELAANPKARRAGGVFYTPPHLVDFIIEKAVVPALTSRSSIQEIFNLRVVDLACGSGVFLSAAIEAIETALVGLGCTPGSALRTKIVSRCIVGFDIDPVAIALCRRALVALVSPRQDDELDKDKDIDIDIRCLDSLTCEDLGQFDLVIGNPPWGQKGLRFDAKTTTVLKQLYRSARGVLDPFKLFIERAQSLLVQGGSWAMVLPDIVLLKNHQLIRELILTETEIQWIAHVGQAFASVNLDACIIVATACVARPEHQVSIVKHLPVSWQRDGFEQSQRKQSRFAALPFAKFNIVATDAELDLVNRLRCFPRLGDLFEIHEGVHSGNRRAELFVQSRPVPGAPLLVGGNELEPFRVRWNGRFLALSPNVVGRNHGGYANIGQPQWHLNTSKIIVRRTGDRLIAAYDKSGRYVSNNFFVLTAKGGDGGKGGMTTLEVRAVVAILNSQFMTWYFRTIQPRVGRMFAELKIVHLRDFPIPVLSYAAARSLATLATKFENHNARLSGGLPSDGATVLVDELNELINELVELSPAERVALTIDK